MKNLVRFAVIAVALMGTFAAAAYSPNHSNPVLVLADGGAPAPLCAPSDTNCDPGPIFGPGRPGGTTTKPGSGSSLSQTPVLLADGGGAPAPLCAPTDTNCDPGPIFGPGRPGGTTTKPSTGTSLR